MTISTPHGRAFLRLPAAAVLLGLLALYTISQVLRFQHGRIAQMARGAE